MANCHEKRALPSELNLKVDKYYIFRYADSSEESSVFFGFWYRVPKNMAFVWLGTPIETPHRANRPRQKRRCIRARPAGFGPNV